MKIDEPKAKDYLKNTTKSLTEINRFMSQHITSNQQYGTSQTGASQRFFSRRQNFHF